MQSALIYPALLLLVAAIGSITLLLTEVLPQFVPLFEQNGAQLPRPTQILIGLGAFVSQYGLAGSGCWRRCAVLACARRCAGPARGWWWTGCCCACRSSAAWRAR